MTISAEKHRQRLGPTLSSEQFQQRFDQLHRQLWQTPEAQFDDVTRHVYSPPAGHYAVDHSFLHDGENWHVFYVTGDLKLIDQWRHHRQRGEWAAANEVCVEPGNGHAAGKDLFSLKFIDNVCFPPQGTFDLGSRAACSVFKFGDRYGMLYDVRGDRGELMSLAWSDDLRDWELDDRNPILVPPAWSNPAGAFKDPHIMEYAGLYLIYAVAWSKQGQVGVCLFTTEDWQQFADHGLVYSAPPMMKGTFGIESPQVVFRDNLWHLFYTHGEGLWHAIAPSPVDFLSGESEGDAVRPMRGAYMIGPFHATEVVCDGDNWWLTTDRKEQTRRQNRQAGRMCYRGTYEDEKTLEEGFYLSRIRWEGDQPVLEKP